MKSVTATAPGKAFLCGEYAVLDGAPAVVMALNRRARAQISAGKGEEHSITAPGYSNVIGRFKTENDGIQWFEGELEYRLFESVFEACDFRPETSLDFLLDTRALHDNGNKLGLGSSAALSAALAMAISEVSGQSAQAFPAAGSGHRAFQKGSGSGADVAAALAGGLIEYRMDESGWMLLDWPTGLQATFFFSGISQNTRDSVGRFSAAESQPSRDELVEAASKMAECWRQENVRVLLASFREYVAVLRRFDRDHDLGIFNAGHDILSDAANELGVVYKPCGAGGGDIGVLLCADPVSVDVFTSLAVSNGFTPLELELDTTGARVSEQAS